MSNYLLLPSILKDGREEAEMPLLQQDLDKYLLLDFYGMVNTGKKTAILVSDTDGYGRFSLSDHRKFQDIGQLYSEQIQLFPKDFYLSLAPEVKAILPSFIAPYTNFDLPVEVIDHASSSDLRDVIRDKDYASIILVGHSSHHAWNASDKCLDWHDLAGMVDDHLKDGCFYLAGCGPIRSWNRVPLGYFVVNDHSHLLGYEASYTSVHGLARLSGLDILKRVPDVNHLIQEVYN